MRLLSVFPTEVQGKKLHEFQRIRWLERLDLLNFFKKYLTFHLMEVV